MKKVIIIGSSSGIGMELARVMSNDGFIVGLTGRRIELLNKLKTELPGKAYIKFIDIGNTNESINVLNELIIQMGGVDMIIISAGIGYINNDLKWEKERKTIETNVLGVTAIINVSIKYFMKKKSGHLVTISSIAALRGSSVSPSYNASKAYISNYMEGIRSKVKKEKVDITITDIKPGLVDTDMAKGEGLFWVMPLSKTANQIYKALKRKRTEIYVTKRWWVMSIIIRLIPKFLYYKIG